MRNPWYSGWRASYSCKTFSIVPIFTSINPTWPWTKKKKKKEKKLIITLLVFGHLFEGSCHRYVLGSHCTRSGSLSILYMLFSRCTSLARLGKFPTLLQSCELEISKKSSYSSIVCGFSKLTICCVCIPLYNAFESAGLRYHCHGIFDRHLLIGIHRNNERFSFVVIPKCPYQDSGQVSGVKKLAQGSSTSWNHHHRGLVLFGLSHSFNGPGNEVAAFAEVVIGSVEVRRDDSCEIAAVLLPIRSTGDVQHAFCVGISIVWRMRGSIMQHAFTNRISRSVREDAGGETRNHLFNLQCILA